MTGVEKDLQNQGGIMHPDEQKNPVDGIKEIKRAAACWAWSEAGLEDKTEILKKEIIYLRNSVSALSAQLDKLMRHSHANSGEIVVPIKQDNQYGAAECRMDPLSR